MQFNINIPCPVCQTNIPADSHQLMLGTKFSCPTCSASIGLSQKSKPEVEQALNDFDQLRSEVSKMKQASE